MMSSFFHFQHTSNTLFNNSFNNYISSSWNINGEGVNTHKKTLKKPGLTRVTLTPLDGQTFRKKKFHSIIMPFNQVTLQWSTQLYTVILLYKPVWFKHVYLIFSGRRYLVSYFGSSIEEFEISFYKLFSYKIFLKYVDYNFNLIVRAWTVQGLFDF